MKLVALVMLFSRAMSSETCEENAVVGHCLITGCYFHGPSHCHGTRCICDPGTCSVDGRSCVQKPSALQAGNVVKIFMVDGASPNRWLSFTATNNEAVQRWYHYMRFVYSYASAMPAKLYDAKSVWGGTYPAYAKTLPNNTFCLQNVYGHGYTPFWVGMAGAGGRLRESYTYVGDKLPIHFVKVGCNRYKMQTMYIGNRHGKFVGQAGRMWISGTDDLEHGVVVSVWGEGETVDECGDSIPTTLAEDAESTAMSAAHGHLDGFTTGFVVGGVTIGLLIAAMVAFRRTAVELRSPLLAC